MPVKDAFLAGVLAHVPETDRGKAEAALIALEEGGLRQTDYSKQVAEAQATKQKFDDLYAKNVEWFAARKQDLTELDALRAKVTTLEAAGGAKPTDQPFKLPDNLVTKKDVEELERGAVGFIAEAQSLGMKHFRDFGEVLNVTDLLADPRVQKIGLVGVYQDKFKDQIAAKQKAADDAKADALRKEGYEKARTELASRTHPYPVVGNEPSSLDAIEVARTGQQPAVRTVDDMAAEYSRLSSTRAGAGAAP